MGTEVNKNVLQEGDLHRASLVSYQVLAHSPMEEEKEMIFKVLVITLLILIVFNSAVTMLLFFGWLESQRKEK
jgi:hypothetical protein